MSSVLAVIVQRSPERVPPVAHTISVTLLNARSGDSVEYVWVSPDVSVTVWQPCSDAADDPVAFSQAKLLMASEARLGNGYRVGRMKQVAGSITLPSGFDLEGYVQKGYELHLAAHVEPDGFRSDEFPFEFDPHAGMGSAYGRVSLNRAFPRGSIPLKYDPYAQSMKSAHCSKAVGRFLSMLRAL